MHGISQTGTHSNPGTILTVFNKQVLLML